MFNDSSPEKVKSKTYLLNSNEVCKSIFLIQKGTAWKFYLKDRTKIATEFVFAEDIILSHSSYLLQIPSKEYIQVLEDSLVYRIEFGKFENMIQKYPILNELDKLILEYNSLKLEDRLNHLLFKTPKEKLEWLLSREPKVLEKIPKKYLASYLGVTLETISRLKKFD
ncbi:MAG: Crp/Fnr family transcriptional regulator [Leptospiraceae bacterium]|nr:Crp/Fnr family transcriptional regulator [Leptospiraceae bacterium]